MRLFVSSTVYDLIDIRADVAELLREIGVVPVMSDDNLSDFHVTQSANSIEACLVNVESSDEMLVILDRRYGPRLGAYGFKNVSATHLEYLRAVEKSKPIHMYVRNRLEADYHIWRRNSDKTSLELSWVQSEGDIGLFELMHCHTALSASTSTTNWYRVFDNSVDLRASLRRHLGQRILPQRLNELQ